MITKIKQNSRAVLAVLILIGSIGLLCFPFVSSYLYEHQTESVVSAYQDHISDMNSKEKEQMWRAAEEYNKTLKQSKVQLTDPFQTDIIPGQTQDYNSLLDPDGSGIMSYLEIPKINVYLPVYHGTEPRTLEQGIGHLEGSSLPVGGENTHCVVSGHTGLKRAKMLTDLTELTEGDHFFFHTLGETLAYQVDQIRVVKPTQLNDLLIVPGGDYATLVTCTPYGVNTHRLLVRGVRVDWNPEKDSTAAEKTVGGSTWMKEYIKALVVGIILVILMIVIARIRKRRKEKP